MSSVSDIKLIRTDTTLDLSQKAEKRYRFLAAEAARPTCLPRACGGALPQASVAVRAACLRAWSPAGQVAKQHCSLEACRASARRVPRDIGQTERAWGSGDGKTRLKGQIARAFFRLRPYHREYTGSRPITEVKPGRAGLVLGWVTAWEYPVL